MRHVEALGGRGEQCGSLEYVILRVGAVVVGAGTERRSGVVEGVAVLKVARNIIDACRRGLVSGNSGKGDSSALGDGSGLAGLAAPWSDTASLVGIGLLTDAGGVESDVVGQLVFAVVAEDNRFTECIRLAGGLDVHLLAVEGDGGSRGDDKLHIDVALLLAGLGGGVEGEADVVLAGGVGRFTFHHGNGELERLVGDV